MAFINTTIEARAKNSINEEQKFKGLLDSIPDIEDRKLLKKGFKTNPY